LSLVLLPFFVFFSVFRGEKKLHSSNVVWFKYTSGIIREVVFYIEHVVKAECLGRVCDPLFSR